MITQSAGACAMERQYGAYGQESSGGRGTDQTHHAACVLTHYQLWACVGPWGYLENCMLVLRSDKVSHIVTVV